MKILVTGATGFVGSHVLKKLAGKYAADQIVILSGSSPVGCFQTIPALDYQFSSEHLVENGCEDIEVVIHIGAFIPKTSIDADNLIQTTGNISGTEKLLLAIDELPHVKKIIYVSTVDVYGIPKGPLSEESLPSPHTLYGWSKLYCEKMVTSFCLDKGITYEILRLGHVYGEGEEKYRKVIPTMIRNAINDEPICILGSGKSVRSFIYIEDVAEAIVNAIEYVQSDTIVIAGSEAVTINELAKMIIAYSDSASRIEYKASEETQRDLLFDNRKLMSSLLKSLTPFSIGLKREIDYMKRLSGK